MTRTKIRILVVVALASIAFLSSSPVDQAEAGILYRHSALRSLVNSRLPRAKTTRVRKSTAFMSRNPISHGTVGTVEDDMKIAEAEYKYQRKVYKWELKKARAEAKALRKRQKAEEAARKKQAKVLAAAGKRPERPSGKVGTAPEKQGAGSYLSSLFSNSADSGKVPLRQEAPKQKPKLSFWGKLKRALVGA